MLIHLKVSRKRTLGGRGKAFRFHFDQDEVLVGRADGVQVRLPHPAVSLVHLVLRRVNSDRLAVADRGSTNGSWLNGKRLEAWRPALLVPGSRLRLGPFELDLEIGPEQGGREADELTGPWRTASYARLLAQEILAEEEGAAGQPYLRVENGPLQGRVQPVPEKDAALVLGRGEDCDLCLPDVDASRRHVELRRRGDAVEVRDLGSKNGLQVDGIRIQGWFKLQTGNEILLGQTLLLYTDPAESYLGSLQQGEEPESGPTLSWDRPDSAAYTLARGQRDLSVSPSRQAGSRWPRSNVDLILAFAAGLLVAGAVVGILLLVL